MLTCTGNSPPLMISLIDGTYDDHDASGTFPVPESGGLPDMDTTEEARLYARLDRHDERLDAVAGQLARVGEQLAVVVDRMQMVTSTRERVSAQDNRLSQIEERMRERIEQAEASARLRFERFDARIWRLTLGGVAIASVAGGPIWELIGMVGT